MLFLLEAKSPMKETQVRYGPEGPGVVHEHIFSYFVPSWWLIFPLISAIIGIILFICTLSKNEEVIKKPISYTIFWCIICCFSFGFPTIVHSMLPGTGHKIATVVLFFLNLVFFYCVFYYLYSDKKDEDKKFLIDLCVWIIKILMWSFFLYSLLLIGFMIFRIGFFN